MNWQAEVELTVTGLGYTLVEAERSTSGLLRVFIEHPNGMPAITVDDCERVTRQLQYVLEVGEVDYQRLEVSSPGLDRPLKNEQDFARFVGERVEVVFRQAVELLSADGKSTYLQKKFVGRLEQIQDEKNNWALLLEPEPQKDQRRSLKSKLSKEEPVMALGFTLEEIRDARLVPIVDFRGKKTDINPDADTGVQPAADASFNENGDR